MSIKQKKGSFYQVIVGPYNQYNSPIIYYIPTSRMNKGIKDMLRKYHLKSWTFGFMNYNQPEDGDTDSDTWEDEEAARKQIIEEHFTSYRDTGSKTEINCKIKEVFIFSY